MMKSTNENETHVFGEAYYPRELVPSTQSLQTSIIETAKQMPQYDAVDKPYSPPLTLLRKLSLWPPSFLQSATMLSFIFIVSGGLFFVATGDQPQTIDTKQKFAFEAFSENDLDWHELMLIDDELLFAQL
jgi:hypothetical protein